MFCSSCGAEIGSSNCFCNQCGRPVAGTVVRQLMQKLPV